MDAGANIAFHNGYRSGWSGIGVTQMRTERRQRPGD